ncbi:glycosyltransferase family 2 protein [Mixia osmundae IAM 14324]|uniref:chitin synthase n=1 Tax=Mixia osmundae (strain CBS 9802 / IAM 14324 / JCM 22182 / KY 12970) TaxID=764103 RepID=G7E0Z7_MIXOS|nr:glycosyltransferase family 2 protein [Mixia osmundae IAM 14324]KEI38858.1 glycosyltransferase family 2 protein [Mixia osmundae IAM 14324]GAA96507.1 hypothetical protein E5Q_03175 [Mixia osmundae IAM 14324]
MLTRDNPRDEIDIGRRVKTRLARVLFITCIALVAPHLSFDRLGPTAFPLIFAVRLVGGYDLKLAAKPCLAEKFEQLIFVSAGSTNVGRLSSRTFSLLGRAPQQVRCHIPAHGRINRPDTVRLALCRLSLVELGNTRDQALQQSGDRSRTWKNLRHFTFFRYTETKGCKDSRQDCQLNKMSSYNWTGNGASDGQRGRPARQAQPANTPFFAGAPDRPERQRPSSADLNPYGSQQSSNSSNEDDKMSSSTLANSASRGVPLHSDSSSSIQSKSPFMHNNDVRSALPTLPILTASGPQQSYRGESRPNLHPQFTDDNVRPAGAKGLAGARFTPTAMQSGNAYSANNDGVRRKKSLVRPDREKIDPGHRLYNYRNHAAAMQADGTGRVGYSTTGNHPNTAPTQPKQTVSMSGNVRPGAPNYAVRSNPVRSAAAATVEGLRRGRSILAREEGMANESGLNFLKRGPTRTGSASKADILADRRRQRIPEEKGKNGKAPLGPWMIYCNIITCCCPGFLLSGCGLRTRDRQRAWREKIGLLGIIFALMAGVGFLTFGFTQSVCGKQPLRYRAGTVQGGSMIYHGYDYSMDKFDHPAAAGIAGGIGNNPLYSNFNAGSKDGSFLFQNVNQKCKGIITPAAGTGIPVDAEGNMGWYFPCNIYDQYLGSSMPNKTGYATGTLCHTASDARTLFEQTTTQEVIGMQRQGPVYYTWDDIKNDTRNLGVYQEHVLDFDLIKWLDRSQVDYPTFYDSLANGNTSYSGRDITMQIFRDSQRDLINCLIDTIKVGVVDTKTIGCMAADVVLYVSLVFIVGVVTIRFAMAVIFGWFLSWRLGAFRNESLEQRRTRAAAIEQWTDDIYRPAPARYRPNVPKSAKQARKSMLPTKSRFSSAVQAPPKQNRDFTPSSDPRRSMAQTASVYGLPGNNSKAKFASGLRSSPPSSPIKGSRSSQSLGFYSKDSYGQSRRSSLSAEGIMGSCPFPLYGVVPQPPKDYMPFNFPLAHAICLVTAYSESVEGLRTTLDSLATTDYPNSHKVILVIADGLVKGSGNKLTTPDIVLSMMRDLVVPRQDVEAHSYVAIADGHKRHNYAKVYAGFYDYDDDTVETSKQQRVPMVLVAKTGNELEQNDAKPGNRGKRDSQMVLMAFLQKVMFDERMTPFEYEFFNSIWRCTGVSPDQYEVTLMVDADTKVFPDSLTRMTACMVHDPEIMGLCGETKIANKGDTWVTAIQVFEYYISHHLTKAFESMFGGVTCLPGCFSMYRIKAPKGADGYWVPILANPDIVEHYSENVVDTLHKKNLLLLGEDRYLTTLMLKTFPKRKMMFCPQAVCKTVVPDTFRVLLSQRRRWINSTIHNLFELLLVRDLCGTFCFSMQFVVFMELAGTMVLPAAIAFTIFLLVKTALPTKPKPIIPLILLGIILGLPGLLIVVTSRRVTYLGWMLIYLFSLPIWNFVLPTYAYWNMNDFSWGETRKIIGVGADKGNHGDKEGVFDSTMITMKRWTEWERDRRFRSGTQSRESIYEYRSASPKRLPNDRHSIVSSADTMPNAAPAVGPENYTKGGQIQYNEISRPLFSPQQVPGYQDYDSSPRAMPVRRPESVAVLELPAPLASQAGSAGLYDPPFDDHSSRSWDVSSRDQASTPDLPGVVRRFTGAPPSAARTQEEYPRHPSDNYDSDDVEREHILDHHVSPVVSPTMGSMAFESVSNNPYAAHLRSESQDASRPMTDQPAQAGGLRESISSRFAPVSLVDDGPTPSESGDIRVVQRQRRSSSNQHLRGASYNEPISPSLPPGAGPAR